MKKFFKVTRVLIFIFITYSGVLLSQNAEKSILESYEKFGGNTKEIAYLHLNKSVYIKNETLAFTAYIFDKSNKVPLTITKNLYCSISDKNGKVVKKKLLKVDNGVVSGIFNIDKNFISGTYTIRAFTNWMLNFKERNYYENQFLVLDNEIKKEIADGNDTYFIEALPEGGHLVQNIKNTLGIIVKNKKGFGLQKAKGKIVDHNNNILSQFNLNQFGIAKVSFFPKSNKKYRVIVKQDTNELIAPIESIKDKGIALSVINLRDKIGVVLNTNKETITEIANRKYVIAIHNGAEIKMTSFMFNQDLQVSKIFKLADLFKGINIITVFDTENKKPILERLFFNDLDIKQTKTDIITTSVASDSISFSLSFKDKIDISKLQHLSISTLPKTTKSYTSGSSIVSQLYLEPYVRGYIQNAGYYFSEITSKKRYDLDKLLITQGWSSYEWADIFDTKKSFDYKFEQGISVVANIKNKIKEGFLVYPLKNNKTKIFNPTKNDKAFVHTNLYPLDQEKYRVSLMKKNSVTTKPILDIEFYPSKVPQLNTKFYKANFQASFSFENLGFKDQFSTIESDVEVLDEITLKSTKEETRIQKIKGKSNGKIDFFTEENTKGGSTLATYLSSRGWIASDFDGILRIINPQPNTPNNNIPLVILDGVFIDDFSFLAGFSLNTVDYIESNKSGVGYGIRGGGGIIKIVTDPVKRRMQIRSKNEVGSFNFPITFDEIKKYYTPIYKDYNSNFFKEYGVISWLPKLKVNENGYLTFKVLNTLTEGINMYIEGFVNGNSLISEVKTIYPFE